jgi:bacterioferritin-associated ferredoxin
LLDALYPPRSQITDPAADTVVCRCEGLTAWDIRTAAAVGTPGPNQIKAFTRCGMGPCQGRQCGSTVSHILSEIHGLPMDEIGYFRIRPPLRPVSLAELAALDEPAE